jgi:hypothetical protein
VTFLRKYTDEYVRDLARMGDVRLRTRVRSTSALLAGNPYLSGSQALDGAKRVICVEGRVWVEYEIRPKSVLMFLAVRPEV